MALSPFSRFQGCLFLALGGHFLDKNHNQRDLEGLWQPWVDILQQPYQARLPEQFWQNLLPQERETDLVNSLIILALYHHENPLGFQQDLCHWFSLWQKISPSSSTMGKDQNPLLLWQRLLTLILSERFHFSQFPELLRNPDHWWADAPKPAFSQYFLDSLTAIANYLENRQPINLHNLYHSEMHWQKFVSTAIYLWGKNPAQPRLILKQLQQLQHSPNTAIARGTYPIPGLGFPLSSLSLALVGAYNGMEISRQTLGKNHSPRFLAATLPLTQLLWQRWAGRLSTITELGSFSSVVFAPLGMQRRSSLKLVSQQDYGQLSITPGN